MDIFTAVVTGAASAALISGIFSLIMWRLNRKAACEDMNSDVIAGLRTLLYIQIKHLGQQYIAAGQISSEDLEDLIDMHTIYHDNLKGNGFLDRIMTAVKALPIV